MTLPLDKADIVGIEKIKNLPDESMNELLASLRSAPIVRDWEDMVKELSPRVPSINAEDLTSILEGLSTLYYLREIADVRPSKFLSDLMKDIRGMKEWKMTEASLSEIKGRFEVLLNVEALTTVYKAVGLQREESNLYCDSKVLSDIRPVFGKEVGRPAGAVITHTLKIGFHEGKSGSHRDCYIALDSEDLDGLAEAIERAQSKDNALRELLAEIKLPDLTA